MHYGGETYKGEKTVIKLYTCEITTAASFRKEKHMVLREFRMRLDLLKKMAPELRMRRQ